LFIYFSYLLWQFSGKTSSPKQKPVELSKLPLN
jgi:hypothetical protein